MSDECYIPSGDKINYQSEDNKQGRAVEPVDPQVQEQVRALLSEDQRKTYETYRRLLDMGIAREIARIDLPLSLYTEWYWQMDLHNLFHFLALRLDAHAQYEIRAYAEVVLQIVRTVCPVAVEAFENHKRNGRSFSGKEVEAIKAMLAGEPCPLGDRDRQLFEAKLS